MIDYIKSLVTIVNPSDSFDMVIRKMAHDSRNVAYPGIVVVLDENEVLKGVMTDGDIRRAYAADVPFSIEVSKVMVKDPITISNKVPEELISSEVLKKVQLNNKHNAEWIRHVLVVDESKKLTNVFDYFHILQSRNGNVNRVAVVGLGYVGLTLAVSLANRGHQVTGVDIDKSIIDSLTCGVPHIFEPGLKDMLKANLDRQSIEFKTTIDSDAHQIYIIAVGTPLNDKAKPDLESLKKSLQSISNKIKKRNQIMLRSTVPVGVTREIVIPFIEEKTNLKAGVDFHVSFAPERTVEGAAMYELKTLPQVVGGYSSRCTQLSVDFWSSLTPTVVRVDSIEAAEMVKLANNTFRDVSFSFSNELALLASKFNVNAFELIKAANEGYPRNKIPLPSPGVGGYCLTKDPILFSSNSLGLRGDAVLGIASRKINERAAKYPIETIHKYIETYNLSLLDLNILVIGIAFKGIPETTDVRGSISIDLLCELKGKVKNLYGWDAVIDSELLDELGYKTSLNIEKIIQKANIILIMNNHPNNIFSEIYNSSKSEKLIFDGWNQLDKMEVEKTEGLIYATMGYISPTG